MRFAAALSAIFLAGSAHAQVGVTFTNGQANYPAPDFSMCDFNVPTTFGNIWYIDPAGDTQNNYTAAGVSLDPLVTPHQGDAAHPWGSLAAVFSVVTGYPRPLLSTGTGLGAGVLSPIKPGDKILLNTGNYGAVAANTNANSSFVVIAANIGQTPTLSSLPINANHLAFDGINIEKLAPPLGSMVDVKGKNIVLNHMSIFTADYATTATWTLSDWITNQGGGVGTTQGVGFGPTAICDKFINSHIFNTMNGAAFSYPNHIWFQNVEIDHFTGDGLDFSGQYVVIDHVHMHDIFPVNAGRHMDMMQGFHAGPANNNIWINANTIVTKEDPLLPNFLTGSYNGGITQTNDDWAMLFITNNTLALSTTFPTALAIGGCNDCVMANNSSDGGITVNPANFSRAQLYRSSNIIVANNVVGGLTCKDPTLSVNTVNNVIMKSSYTGNQSCFNGTQSSTFGGIGGVTVLGGNYVDTGGITSEFTNIDYTNLIYNFHLLSTAPARGFGRTAYPRPLVDQLGLPLCSPPDAGALAYP